MRTLLRGQEHVGMETETEVSSELSETKEELAFRLEINHDELIVRLHVEPRSSNSILTESALRDALKEGNVHVGIDDAAIAEAFHRLPTFEVPGESFVIARGIPPIHGKNGKVEYLVDVSGKAVYRTREDGQIDFREATSIISVQPGTPLAKLIPPTEGKDGLNLAGRPIAARNGKPASLRAGEGCELIETEGIIKATIEGRPVYSHGTLSVSPIYEVAKDVDFSTGNIKFNGHVLVRGNLLDDFAIEARSVEIWGTVGASRIRCEQSIVIHGGINGRDRALIEANGDIQVKYINQAKVIARGNVTVARSIFNSTVWCQGKVQADTIVGGQCLALRGFDVRILGSELGVPTEIEPGTNFELRSIELEIERLDEEIESLLRPIMPYFGDRARYRRLPEEKKNEYRELYARFTEMKKKHEELMAARRSLLEKEDLTPVREVIVRKLLHHDVTVRTSRCMKHFTHQLTGPLILEEDIEYATIRPSSHAPKKEQEEEEEGDERQGSQKK